MPKPKSDTVIVSGVGVAAGSATVQGYMRTFSRPAPDHQIYPLIGQVASEWAHFEHMLDRLIWQLAEVEDVRGACITAQLMGIWPRFNTIKALLTHRSTAEPQLKPFIKASTEISNCCRDLSEDRNRIIHDPWYADPSDGQAARRISMPRSDLRYGLKDHDIDQMNATLAKIASTAQKVQSLTLRITSSLRASPSKHP
jgi:hypothetical protein